MRTLSTLLFICFAAFSFSQGPFSNGCTTLLTPTCSGTFIPLSTGASPNPVFTDSSNISNPLVNPNSIPGNLGCLYNGEFNPNWILLTIETAGELEFYFSVSAGFLDWIMWSYDSTTCQMISSNTLPPVACNWNGSASGLTGIANPSSIPSGGSQSNFENPILVNAGDQFIICVSNSASQTGNMLFQNIGTAGICQATTEITEETTSHDKELIKIVDVTGREVNDQPNMVLIYMYSDGSSERIFKTE